MGQDAPLPGMVEALFDSVPMEPDRRLRLQGVDAAPAILLGGSTDPVSPAGLRASHDRKSPVLDRVF
jgi:hypothetical protein